MARFRRADPVPQRPGMDSGGEKPVSPKVEAALLTQPEDAPRIKQDDVDKALAILGKYKDGKRNLEDRIIDDELWWELRHWEAIERNGRKDCKGRLIARGPEPTSAWLFNAIINKHADVMDNYPEPVCLPRERSDEESAHVLSEVLPVILEYNDFEQKYSNNWWEKLKHGTAVYGVHWNTELENGLGDIDIREVDLLNIFWEPGITDIQKSRNLFTVELVDNDILEAQYPQLEGKLGRSPSGIDVEHYLYDDTVDTSNKTLVIDWYYKTTGAGSRRQVHYAKIAAGQLLYASENDKKYRDRGYYDHGLYPYRFDVLFPEKGTPCGFGYVAICRDPQLYIDKLFGNILDYADEATRPRFLISSATGINEAEYNDRKKRIVHVEGMLDDARVKQIVLEPLSSIYTNILQMKIEEMKDTSANRDVNSGGTTHGVTAASAIAALQEAGNKVSRDMIAASYRSHAAIVKQCIELIRQFYDEKRSFRITGDNGKGYDFVEINNAAIQDQQIGQSADGSPLYRRPVFDIEVSAQKKNPFSRMEQNERAKELYAAGFFNPERAQEAQGALEMMDFEGIERVRERVQEGQTLYNLCQQLSAQLDQAMQIIAQLTGETMTAPADAGGMNGGGGRSPGAVPSGGADRLARSTMQAHTPMTSYGDRLAKRSTPSVEGN